MTRVAGWTGLTVALFIALMLTLGWVEAHGFVSTEVTQLWAKAIMQIGSAGQFVASDAFYPPVPYSLTLLIQSVAGGSDVPSPFVLSAALGAVILVLWLRNLWRTDGFSLAGSCVIVALFALNPYFLRAMADGPETMFTLLGTWIFARGLVNLRITGNAPDMMKVAVGLLIVALSDNYGLMISLGALPFLIVAARPNMIAASSIGYLFAMFYPVAAALGALFFVAKIFNSSLVPQLIEGPSQMLASEHLLVLSGIAPAVLTVVFRNIRTPSLFMPLFAAMCSVLGAYLLNIYINVESDPLIAISPMLSVVAVGIRFWPRSGLRTPIAAVVMVATALQAVQVVRVTTGPESQAWFQAITAGRANTPDPAVQTAAFLKDKSGIMIDAERNPELVVAMSEIGSLIIAGERLYDWALEGGLLLAPYIVVPKPTDGSQTKDRILLRFPQLRQGEQPGYEQIYENSRWRVFTKTGI